MRTTVKGENFVLAATTNRMDWTKQGILLEIGIVPRISCDFEFLLSAIAGEPVTNGYFFAMAALVKAESSAIRTQVTG